MPRAGTKNDNHMSKTHVKAKSTIFPEGIFLGRMTALPSFNKINILFMIDSFYGYGGSELSIYRLLMGLDKAKFTPILCCLRAGEHGLTQELRQSHVQVINLDMKRFYTFNGLRKLISLINIIKRHRINLIVTYHQDSDFIGFLLSKIMNVPIISSKRDMGYSLKRRYIMTYRVISKFYDAIITVSDAVKQEVLKRDRISNKIYTIYNGVPLPQSTERIDVKAFKTALGIKPPASVVVMLGSLRKIKGYVYYLQAAKIVLSKTSHIHFLIVGGDTKEKGTCWKDLEALCYDLGIASNVHYLGRRNDVADILSVIDITVQSSLSEGFSNTILESMAAGKPVVATNVGGNPEAVIDGETGFLVPPKDAKALAKATCKLLQDKELAQKMGEAGRKRAEQLFNIERMIKDMETLYDVVLEKKLGSKRVLSFKPTGRKFLRLFKIILSKMLYYSGIISLFEKLKSFNGIRILAYHKINNDCPNYLNLSTKISNFEKQMEYLRKHYHIVSLQEVVSLMKANQKIPKRTVAITFDDGYKDTYTNAYPILKKYNIPATIFLTLNPIEYKIPLWFECIIYAITNTSRKTLNLEPVGLKKYLVDSLKEKRETIDQIVSYTKKLNKEDREILLKFMSKELQVDLDDLKMKEELLSWEEINEMKSNGISFGAHSMSHSILTQMPLKEAEYEICESKRMIGEKLGEKVSFFAYPNGGKGDFNEDIINILKDNGFSGACTLIEGVNNTDTFALKRLNIYEEVTRGISGAFSKPLFAAEISGIFNFLRQFLKGT